jgi:uncharacterized protein (DUF427 family)
MSAYTELPPSLRHRSAEPSERWVRVKFAGEIIADSRRTLLLRQYGPSMMPTYCFPPEDVRADVRVPGSEIREGEVERWDVRVGDRVAVHAGITYLSPGAEQAALTGYVTFQWGRMDAWYEEDEQIFVHARDTRKRVDVLPSSRHVRVVVAGETIAESTRSSLLFETDLPTRYYIPREDVRMELLEPTRMKTRCPYKGVATYWSAKVGNQVTKNVVWCYEDPIPECPKIRGLLCFFNERVDLYVDDELQVRPKTPWSEDPAW